jgi:hypothetical protein
MISSKPFTGYWSRIGLIDPENSSEMDPSLHRADHRDTPRNSGQDITYRCTALLPALAGDNGHNHGDS